MCYAKPGPRCSGHTKKDLIRDVDRYEKDPSESNYAMLTTSTLERMAYPQSQQEREAVAEKTGTSAEWVSDIQNMEAQVNKQRLKQYKQIHREGSLTPEEKKEATARAEQQIRNARNRALDELQKKHGYSAEEERERFVALGRAMKEKTIADDEKTNSIIEREAAVRAETMRARTSGESGSGSEKSEKQHRREWALSAMDSSHEDLGRRISAATLYLKTMDDQEMHEVSLRSGVNPLVLKNLKAGDPVAAEELMEKHPLTLAALHREGIFKDAGRYDGVDASSVQHKMLWTDGRPSSHTRLGVQVASTVHDNGNGKSYNVTQYKGNPTFNKHFDRARNISGDKSTTVSVITPVDKPNGPTKVMISTDQGVPTAHHFPSLAAADLWVGENTILARRRMEKEKAEPSSPLRKLVRDVKDIRDARRAAFEGVS